MKSTTTHQKHTRNNARLFRNMIPNVFFATKHTLHALALPRTASHHLVVLLINRLTSALFPAVTVQDVAIRALSPRVRLAAQLHVRHIGSRVVVVVHDDVVNCH